MYEKKSFEKILSGPSLVSGHLNWLLALEQDMVPKDVLEKYEKGEDINYNTAYGKGYITKEGHEKMKKYAINIDEPIEVLMNNNFPTNPTIQSSHFFQNSTDSLPYQNHSCFQRRGSGFGKISDLS